jgi:hypothetical protein
LRKQPLDHVAYFSALRKVFGELKKIPFSLGLSLSGLEATADPAWLQQLCHLLREPEFAGIFDEKVMYTNGSGLADAPWLIEELRGADFDRIELSRQHYKEKKNQRIMRFGAKVEVRHNEVYEEMVRMITGEKGGRGEEGAEKGGRGRRQGRGEVGKLKVKNSCILSKPGINSVEEIEEYVRWARSLGIRTCVFRELSRLPEEDGGEREGEGGDRGEGKDRKNEVGYVPNRTKNWISDNRVRMEDIAGRLVFQNSGVWRARDGWKFLHSSVGYYYYNEHYLVDDVEVIIEVSSYEVLEKALERREEGEASREGEGGGAVVADKLVFHSNGNLTTGWDPKNNVVTFFDVHGALTCTENSW